MYIKRNAVGDIEQVSRLATAECDEWLAADDAELDAFLGREQEDEAKALESSDLAFVRVLEDVIDVLIERNLISFTDLPAAARDKLMARQTLRQQRNSVGLLSGEEEDDAI